MLVHAAVQVQL